MNPIFCVDKHPIWKSGIGSTLVMSLNYESQLKEFRIKVASISKPTMFELTLVMSSGECEKWYLLKKDAIKHTKVNWLDTYAKYVCIEFIEHKNVDMSKLLLQSPQSDSSNSTSPITSTPSSPTRSSSPSVDDSHSSPSSPLRKLFVKRFSLQLRKSVECVSDSESSQRSPHSPHSSQPHSPHSPQPHSPHSPQPHSPHSPHLSESKSLFRKSLQFLSPRASSPRSHSPNSPKSRSSNSSPRHNESPRSQSNSNNNSPRPSKESPNNSPRVSRRSGSTALTISLESIDKSQTIAQNITREEQIDFELSTQPSPKVVLQKK